MANSEAPADPRPYVRISTDLPLNPKLAAIDDPAASWAYVVSISYCGGSFTDGHFVIAAVIRLAGVDKAIATALVEQELWHLPGHECDRCPQPKPGHAYVHDYLQHQRSADEVRDLTSKRRDAGRAGAAARWGKGKPAEKPPGKRIANAMASAEQPLWQNDGKAMAEERRGEERRNTAPTVLPASRALAVVPDAPLSITQRSKLITDAYAVVEPMCKWPAVNGIVIKAIRTEKWTDDEICDALLRLAKEGRAVTVETLRVEVSGMPPSSARASPASQLQERGGLMLGARNIANAERAERMAAIQQQRDLAAQTAIEGGKP